MRVRGVIWTGIIMLGLAAIQVPRGATAQTLSELRAAVDRSPADPDVLARYLVAYATDPTNRASRVERRGIERMLSARLLDLDPAHHVGLDVAARWALDDYLWNATSEERFRTSYFERRRDRAFERTEALLFRLRNADPNGPEPYRRLAALYAYAAHWEAVERVSHDLARARPGDPDADLLAGLARHMLDEDEAAARAFARALAAMPPDRASTYRSTAQVVSPDADPAEIPDHDEFWSHRDPRLLTPHNERFTEHVARMVLADLFFGSAMEPGWTPVQGELIVRYGLPENHAATLAPYGRAGVDYWGAVKIWRYPDFEFVLEDPYRTGDFRFYAPSVTAKLPDYEIAARERLRFNPESYTLSVPGRRVDMPWTVSLLRGPRGRTDAVIGFGIPLEGEAPDGPFLPFAVDTGVFLTAASNVVVEDRRTRTRLPSDRVVRAGPDLLWAGAHNLSVEPGAYRIAVEFETTDGSVVAFSRDTLQVDRFAPGHLAMSDIVIAYLAREAEPGDRDLVRSGIAIRPAAWNVFETGQSLYLYFETYGLRSDAAKRSTITVEVAMAPADRRSGIRGFLQGLFGGEESGGVSVRFEASALGPDDARYLVLDTAELEAGTFTLSVRITDHLSGERVERSRPVVLVAPSGD